MRSTPVSDDLKIDYVEFASPDIAASKAFFSEAFGWMTRVALAAEKAGHHPDWSNSWNTVDVSLSTHSEGKLTEKDVKLAGVMEKLAG